jgi:hypothetical protein
MELSRLSTMDDGWPAPRLDGGTGAGYIRLRKVGKTAMTCRAICRTLLTATVLLAAIGATMARAAELQTVRFGTDWKAEAEHGGYYQAIATGIYRRYGLDVKLQQGGPQVNHAELLAAGRLDFNIATTLLSRSISCAKTSRWSRSPRCFRRTPRC